MEATRYEIIMSKSMFRDIFFQKLIIGQFYDLNSASGINFPTPIDSDFQFGYAIVDQNKTLTPHIHKRVERRINTTSEFLYVVDGEMIIEIYSEDETYIETVILKKNQALLQFIGGHKISMKKGTKYFELKQGPYFGKDFDKYELGSNDEL